jgi:hypothetical protein
MSIQPPTLPDSFDLSIELRQKTARRRWWLIAAMGLLVPVALVTIAVVSVFVWLGARQRTALRDVQQEVIRIQSSGEPITTEDLYAVHRVPQGVRDVTPLWEAALNSFDGEEFKTDFANLQKVEDENSSDAAVETEEWLTASEQFLAKYDLTIQQTLVAAQAKGECRFPVEFKEGINADLSHADQLRHTARLLSIRLRVSKARGDTKAALESLHAIFSESHPLESSPILIEQIAGIAISGVALLHTESVLYGLELNDAQLVRLRQEVQNQFFEKRLTTALIGERAMGYHAFHHLGQLADSHPLDAHDGKLTLPVDCRFYLDQMRQSIDASRLPYPAALQAADLVAARIAEATRHPIEHYAYLVTLTLSPMHEIVFEMTARSVARRELMLCAIAAERYRAEHRHAPESLESLVPEFLTSIPTDPFNGQTVQFKASDQELLFYSVGANAVDDGGMENDHYSEPDIVVRLKRR